MMSDKWISVEDRLPSVGDNVLVTRQVYINEFWFACCKYRSFGFPFTSFPDGRDGITHWQPLPEPPKPINTSKPDDSILKQIDGYYGYKEGEE